MKKLIAAAIAASFATVAFAQAPAPAKKDDKAAAPAAAPAKKADDKKAAPAKKDEKKADAAKK